MTLLIFLVLLSILVLVHELGHFLVAKKAGILVEEFGLGYPPRIWSKKIGETVYSINLFPIGGFVKLYGEDALEPEGKSKKGKKYAGRAFFEKSKKVRLGVILAGVVMNYLLAIGVFAGLYSVTGIPEKTDKVKIVGVAEGSPAEKSGLKVEDQLLAIDQQKFTSIEEFIEITKEKAGKEVELEILREKDNPCPANVLGGGSDYLSTTRISSEGDRENYLCKDGHLIVSLTPRADPPEGEGALGVAISSIEMKKYSAWRMPIYGAREGFKESVAWGKTIVSSLAEMLGNLIFQGQVPKDVAGPIGVYQVTGMVAKTGLLSVLEFLGILSVNLAIVNILPFPALDGGRLLFLVIESVFGKKLAPKLEAWVNNIGMILLLLLVLLVTINDIARVLSTSLFWEKLKLIF